MRVAALRKAYSDVCELILATVPTSRERSVAMTELETSAMWAIKALTHNQPEQQTGEQTKPG